MDCSYYVYMHQDKDGKVFYIGKGKVSGTGRVYRHLTWGMRNDDWKTIATKGYTSQVLTYGSERDMFYLERFLIKSLSDSGLELVNRVHNKNYTYPPVPLSRREKISAAKIGRPNITWRNDKSTDLYKQKRQQQRRDFYKQKEVS